LITYSLFPPLFRAAEKSSNQEDRRKSKRGREQEDGSDYGNEEKSEDDSGSDNASAEEVGSRRTATIKAPTGTLNHPQPEELKCIYIYIYIYYIHYNSSGWGGCIFAKC
jgi:hypothetical protein